MRDRVAGTTVLASSNAAGQAANAEVLAEDVGNVQFAISGNGRYAVFASNATNLTPQDTDTNRDVFRKDLVTGAVDLISLTSTGQKPNAGVFGDPDVSYDGNRVSFGSGDATDLFPGDTNGASDIVVRDVAAGHHRARRAEQRRGAGERHHRALGDLRRRARGGVRGVRPPRSTSCPATTLNVGNDAIVRNLAGRYHGRRRATPRRRPARASRTSPGTGATSSSRPATRTTRSTT